MKPARQFNFDPGNQAIVRVEDPLAIADLRADAIAYYQPVNSQEMFAVERIALAQHEMLRAGQMLTGFFTTAVNDAMETPGVPFVLYRPELTQNLKIAAGQNRGYWLSPGFRHVMDAEPGVRSFAFLLRYQAQAERLHRRAVEEFERLEKRRAETDTEPMPDSGPVILYDAADDRRLHLVTDPPDTEPEAQPDSPDPSSAPQPTPVDPPPSTSPIAEPPSEPPTSPIVDPTLTPLPSGTDPKPPRDTCGNGSKSLSP